MPIYDHDNYIPLNDGVKLWRYLDFEKFKSLLETRSLFFCRADKFSDPFEGSIPKKEADFRMTTYKKHSTQFQYPFDENQASHYIKGIQILHQKFKRGFIVNCWHINENESDAMWRLYLKDNEGVAIQTNKEKLTNTLNKISEEISVSKVRYLNYETDTWFDSKDYPHSSYNMIVPLVHKRIEFVHEQECRLFVQIQEAIDNENYWDNKPNEKGKLIQLDIVELIDKIYLPPTCDDKTENKIKKLADSLGYTFNFIKSKLSAEPFY
jgi:hypothetical protein